MSPRGIPRRRLRQSLAQSPTEARNFATRSASGSNRDARTRVHRILHSTRFNQTMSQLVLTPVGNLSVLGFETPVPYPFGAERTGYLVADLDAAVQAARDDGADVIVSPFPDPLGRDAIIQWPGGVNMQLYRRTTPPSYAPLATVPENRIYVSEDRAGVFIRDFLAFSHGVVTSDDAAAPGAEIGRPSEVYRRVRIASPVGKLAVLVTDGDLPWPYGRELAGYEVSSVAETLDKAIAAGAG